MKSGNLNFLEPSGPIEACNGTALALPLPFTLVVKIVYKLIAVNNSLNIMYFIT